MIGDPILDIYLVWHPYDIFAKRVSKSLMQHFHGPVFSGSEAGPLEVYNLFKPWSPSGGPPRPITTDRSTESESSAAIHTAIVPILGIGMARAFDEEPEWTHYLTNLFQLGENSSVGIYPIVEKFGQLNGSRLMKTAGKFQAIRTSSEDNFASMQRDLVQALAQQLYVDLGFSGRIKIFISHTKHYSDAERNSAKQVDVIAVVRDILDKTHLDTFFDSSNLQPGSRWENELKKENETCAILMVRTDEYASRAWPQREILLAKDTDLPIMELSARVQGEKVGTFLLGNIKTHEFDVDEAQESVKAALSRLVDETLLHALRRLAFRSVSKDYICTTSNRPEPLTVGPRHAEWHRNNASPTNCRVLHGDPALTDVEIEGFSRAMSLSENTCTLEFHTPHTLRQGSWKAISGPRTKNQKPLEGMTVGISVSNSPDENALGLMQEHSYKAVAELVQAIFIAGGHVVYGGRLKDPGYTKVIMDALDNYSSDRYMLSICVPVHKHSELSYPELLNLDNLLGTRGRLILLDHNGTPMPLHTCKSLSHVKHSPELISQGLSAMRRYVTSKSDARIVVGGRLEKSSGAMPGVIEESILAIRGNIPLYVAGGFGGAAAQIARTLNLHDFASIPRLRRPNLTDKASNSLKVLADVFKPGLVNDGLGDDERRRLAATYRVTDIVNIAMTGLTTVWQNSASRPRQALTLVNNAST